MNTTWRNQHVPEPSRHRALLTISGTDLGVELPRPLPPHMRYVGPLLAAPPQPLPPDLEGFVAGGSLRTCSTCHSEQIQCPSAFASLLAQHLYDISVRSHIWRATCAPAGAGQPGVILAAFGSMMNVEPHALVVLAKMFAVLPQVGSVICNTQI